MNYDKYTPRSTDLGGSSSGASSGEGGSSGASMLSGFTTLGTKIHEDSLESMSYFQQLEAARRDRERQIQMDMENRRQRGLQNAQTNRGQNLSGIEILQGQRDRAQKNANRMTFKDAFSKAITGAV